MYFIRAMLILFTFSGLFRQKTIIIDKIKRHYAIYLPDTTGTAKFPVIFVLHGGGGSIRSIRRLTKYHFEELADSLKFMVVYPLGYKHHWNDGRKIKRYAAFKLNINDVEFIKSIIDSIQAYYTVDTSRIFATGISNGGLMAFRLACETAEFKKIAPVSALMPLSLIKICNPEHPVSMMLFLGTKDALVPLKGGDIHFFRRRLGKVISFDSTLSLWSKINLCRENNIKKIDKDILVETFEKCKNSTRIIAYLLNGGGHTWPGGKSLLPPYIVGKQTEYLQATDSIVQFFLKQ